MSLMFKGDNEPWTFSSKTIGFGDPFSLSLSAGLDDVFGDEDFFPSGNNIEHSLSADVLVAPAAGDNVDDDLDDRKDMLNEIIALSKSVDFEEQVNSSPFSDWKAAEDFLVKEERSSPDSGIVIASRSPSGNTTPKSELSDFAMEFITESEVCTSPMGHLNPSSFSPIQPEPALAVKSEPPEESAEDTLKILTIAADGTVSVTNGRRVSPVKVERLTSDSTAAKHRTVRVQSASAVKVPICKPKATKPVVVNTSVIGSLISQGLVKVEPQFRVKLESGSVTPCAKLPIAPKPVVSQTVPLSSSVTVQYGSSAPIPVSTTVPVSPAEAEALRRQQRMIKNRESASLSRKKKKEYVATLEQEIHNLRQRNEELEQENRALRERLAKSEQEKDVIRSGILTADPKKVTALFAISMLLSLNILSFGVPGLSRESSVQNDPLNLPLHHHFGRSLQSIGEEDAYTAVDRVFLTNMTDSTIQPSVCPMLINSTESLRLNSDLHGLFSKKETATPKKKAMTRSLGPLLTRVSMEVETKPTISPDRFRNYLVSHPRKAMANPEGVELFRLKGPEQDKLLAFMNSIKRRHDTYYVVSFSADHLLVPATAQNSTMRPKMSLLLPALYLNESMTPPPKHIAMMQIDCEVTDTRLVHVEETIASSLNTTRPSSQPTGFEPKPKPRPATRSKPKMKSTNESLSGEKDQWRK